MQVREAERQPLVSGGRGVSGSRAPPHTGRAKNDTSESDSAHEAPARVGGYLCSPGPDPPRPATGAAAAAFGAYLRELGAVEPAAVLTLHQGDDLGRPAILGVELRQDDPRVRVSGAAVALPD
ncbi:PhzF family phenazine biosynthesis protein [Nocardia sp. NEAU-G5]|uniref:PhzF family phenazine biosynthesis protein n=1 Tax=Nocardia albiluteola TaxID=2842303 RepID=A0ABS6BA26_9NOCA|nr:PhzF family phenazine biosynthesis protein [Nocardia albiluteola]MBU3067152.1 PhzF family phenazine biosynthesis protein [Nocardia albiluteola]